MERCHPSRSKRLGKGEPTRKERMSDGKYVYLGRDLDGQIFSACADLWEHRARILEFVGEVIRDGGNVERVTLAEFKGLPWGKEPWRLHPKIDALPEEPRG